MLGMSLLRNITHPANLLRNSSFVYQWTIDRCTVCTYQQLQTGQKSAFFAAPTSRSQFRSRSTFSVACAETCTPWVLRAAGREISSRRSFSTSPITLQETSLMQKLSSLVLSNGQKRWLWEKKQIFKEKFFIMGKRKKALKRAAVVMYGCCTDPLNHLHFFSVLGLPDTFNSWQKITELHVWLCLVRLGNELTDGKFVRGQITRAFWEDVDARSQQLGPAALMNRKKGLGELGDQFRASMFGYDEGLLADDKVLAAAIWRHFFGQQCNDPRKLELLVYYIRKQIENLETQDRHQILHQGIVRWLPLTEIKD